MYPDTVGEAVQADTKETQEDEELHNRIIQHGPSILDQQIDAAAPCMAQFPPEVLIEPLPNCTQEQIDQVLPCTVHQ